METLYRKVAVSEEKPKSTGFYWIENIVGEMKSSYYDSILGMFIGDYANFWLKPAESPTAQLKADKAELLEALEIFFPMFTELDSEFGIENPHPRKWTETEIATVQKLFDLIQKMKQ